MKKFLLILSVLWAGLLLVPSHAMAITNADVQPYTTDLLGTLTLLGTFVSGLFLVKGGYSYITSSGNPENLVKAKKTIRNALIGLVFIIGAGTITAILSHAFETPISPSNTGGLSLTPIQPATPSGGLAQVLIDAFVGVLQNVIQSATKPLVDGVITFLTTTPQLATNSVVFNFWLVILGITDSLFAVIIALLGFHVMSASAFGYEDIDLKQVMSRIVLAFLGANISIFLIDRIITLCNTMIKAVLNATGGITGAWVLSAFDPTTIVSNNTPLITLIFMLLFIILTIILLLYYIGRLITISLGAVLSPLIFLMWALPGTSDFAKIAAKSYMVTIFTVFIHVVTIQLASSFLTVSSQSGTNSLISILIAVGIFFSLLKIPGVLGQMAFYTSVNGAFKAVGSQLINVISAKKEENTEDSYGTSEPVKKPARRVAI